MELQLTRNSSDLSKSVKNGLIAGFLAVAVNVLYWFVFKMIVELQTDVINFISITIATVLPLLLASAFYFLLQMLSKKHSQTIFVIVSTVIVLISCLGPYSIEILPNGEPKPEYFTLLTIPMHAIAGLVAIWFIPVSKAEEY